MSIRVVLRYLGIVLLIYGALFLFPLGWSLAVQDGAATCFVAPGLLASGAGLLLWKMLPSRKANLSRREGLALVAWTWIAASLIGALPFVISGTLPRYVDAFFETMSGFTTTGATVIPLLGVQPPSVLLWRNFTQWIGGLGIVMIFVALSPALGIGAARLLDVETTGPQKDKLRVRAVDTARILWLLYVGLTATEVGLLLVGGKLPFYDSLNIAFATMPTGGFLHLQDSIGAYADRPFITTVITFFMLAAGTNFSLYYYALRQRRVCAIFQNAEFRLFICIFVVAVLLMTLDLMRAGMFSFPRALQHATFNIASIQTATGFATTDFNQWPALSRGLFLVLMLVGGCAGSTAGGFKVVRLLVIAKYAWRGITKAFSLHLVSPVWVGGQSLPEPVVSRVVGTTCVYILTVFGGFIVMSGLGLDGIGALSAVATTLGNVGPGLAEVGPSANYAFLPDAGKLVLTGLMLAGRLEFVAVLALLQPAFWRWR